MCKKMHIGFAVNQTDWRVCANFTHTGNRQTTKDYSSAEKGI